MHFRSEESMLGAFLDYWQENFPDVITGWNVQLFDMPYICNRVEYILLVWAVIYGRIIWGETISLQSWVGIVIIVTGGIYIFYRERINEQILATDQTIR